MYGLGDQIYRNKARRTCAKGNIGALIIGFWAHDTRMIKKEPPKIVSVII